MKKSDKNQNKDKDSAITVIAGEEYDTGLPDPNGEGIIIDFVVRQNGYLITCGIYEEPAEYPDDPEDGYGYALDFDGNFMYTCDVV